MDYDNDSIIQTLDPTLPKMQLDIAFNHIFPKLPSALTVNENKLWWKETNNKVQYIQCYYTR